MCNNIEKNINDENSLVQYGKIYKFNENNEIIDYAYAYNFNYSELVTNNLNDNISNSINYTNKLSFLVPGNISISLQEAIYNSINNKINLNDYLLYNSTLTKIKPTNFRNLSFYVEPGYSYVSTNMNDNNYFSLSEVDLSNLIINDLRNISNEFSLILSNEAEILGIKNIINETIWNFDKLSKEQINFIFSLLGKQYSSFFYSWYYKDYLKGNLSNIIARIKKEFNSNEFGELINVLWFSERAYFNLIFIDNENQEIKDFQNFLLKKYPINIMNNSNIVVSEKDLNFFKHWIIKIENSKVFILNNEGVYSQVKKDDFLSVFKINKLESQQDWIDYLTKGNIPTVNFINNTYDKLRNLCPNIVNINILNNNFDLTSFIQVFDLKNEPFTSGWITSILLQISLSFIFIFLAYISYMKVRLD